MEKEYAVLIGYRIRQERVQRNISQPEMADILGISYSYYNNIEKGNRNCPIVQIAIQNGHLCHVRRSVCDIIGGQPKTN